MKICGVTDSKKGFASIVNFADLCQILYVQRSLVSNSQLCMYFVSELLQRVKV